MLSDLMKAAFEAAEKPAQNGDFTTISIGKTPSRTRLRDLLAPRRQQVGGGLRVGKNRLPNLIAAAIIPDAGIKIP
ncbi:MAG TPA: hypothetical protein VFF96_04990 [Pseudoxanthomonas sp.]|nr:hypothetical protein [Pseudoxanthomonas sp.]